MLRLLLALPLLFAAAFAHAQPLVVSSDAPPSARPVYPVIFIHGLDSGGQAWTSTLDSLRLVYGPPQTIPYRLNTSFNTDAQSDVSLDVNTQLVDGDLFMLNFDVNLSFVAQASDDISGESESNEAAIAKQGYALGDAIRRVLQVTGAERVSLVGHSMGGLAAREYLQRATDGQPWWWHPDDGHRVA